MRWHEREGGVEGGCVWKVDQIGMVTRIVWRCLEREGVIRNERSDYKLKGVVKYELRVQKNRDLHNEGLYFDMCQIS